MSHDYVPQAEGAFLEWARTLITYAGARTAAFNVPAGAITPLQTQLTEYEAAFNAAQNPNRGRVDILRKKETREALKTSVRIFVKAYISYNPDVSDADKESMGLPLHDGVRTPALPPATMPELETDSSVIRQITIHFRDAGSGRRGKPEHVHGVELRWAILESAPSSVDELTNSEFDTASPHTLKFDEAERGGSLYICPRWENHKGDKGPWGEIHKAIVP
jgi:hypothetical protein